MPWKFSVKQVSCEGKPASLLRVSCGDLKWLERHGSRLCQHLSDDLEGIQIGKMEPLYLVEGPNSTLLGLLLGRHVHGVVAVYMPRIRGYVVGATCLGHWKAGYVFPLSAIEGR